MMDMSTSALSLEFDPPHSQPVESSKLLVPVDIPRVEMITKPDTYVFRDFWI